MPSAKVISFPEVDIEVAQLLPPCKKNVRDHHVWNCCQKELRRQHSAHLNGNHCTGSKLQVPTCRQSFARTGLTWWLSLFVCPYVSIVTFVDL
jgi:hypothetical protein